MREQFNSITSFIDGSGVYGSDSETARRLRAGRGGRLRTNPRVLRAALPTRQQCGLAAQQPHRPSDLAAGDERAIVQPALTAMHTLFLREHNRLADRLAVSLAPQLAGRDLVDIDETLYQEARRLLVAQMQNIVYSEYLPLLLGRTGLNNLNINAELTTAYDDSLGTTKHFVLLSSKLYACLSPCLARS